MSRKTIDEKIDEIRRLRAERKILDTQFDEMSWENYSEKRKLAIKINNISAVITKLFNEDGVTEKIIAERIKI